MGFRDKLENIGQKQMIEGAFRLQNHMKSFDTNIRDLQDAFNNNTKAFVKKLEDIETKLDSIECLLKKQKDSGSDKE